MAELICARDLRTSITVEIDGDPFPVFAVSRYRDGRLAISDDRGRRVELDADDHLPVVAWKLLPSPEVTADA